MPAENAVQQPPRTTPQLVSTDTSEVRDIAPPARVRGRHWGVILSFWLFVLLPCAICGGYLAHIAEDQFSSKVGFSVQREDSSSPVEILGGLSSLTNFSSSDTDILYEYIQSQKLVQEIDAQLNLHKLWHHPDDFVFALSQDASLEDMVKYWNRMVRISYAEGSGIIEVEALAFSSESATRITQAILEKSAHMINALNDLAQQDSVTYAKQELSEALERLKEARAELTRFRNVNQIVDPEVDIMIQAGLLESLQQQQALALIKLDLLKSNAKDSDPRIKQETKRLEVIETRIEAERRKLGMGRGAAGDLAFADLLGEYEKLVVDREFAEKSYISTLATYDSAVAESRRKTRYLATYLEPTQAQTAQYPKRVTIFSLFTLFVVLLWSVGVLVAYSIRDRR